MVLFVPELAKRGDGSNWRRSDRELLLPAFQMAAAVLLRSCRTSQPLHLLNFPSFPPQYVTGLPTSNNRCTGTLSFDTVSLDPDSFL